MWHLPGKIVIQVKRICDLKLSHNLIAQASASSPASLLESCLSKQKATIFGPNRDHSCDSCDVHLSEKEWLENHKKGEKHRWVTERVKLLLPVQWIQPPPKTVLRGANVPPELVCVVCQQGFWPLDKYRQGNIGQFSNGVQHFTAGNTLGVFTI